MHVQPLFHLEVTYERTLSHNQTKTGFWMCKGSVVESNLDLVKVNRFRRLAVKPRQRACSCLSSGSKWHVCACWDGCVCPHSVSQLSLQSVYVWLQGKSSSKKWILTRRAAHINSLSHIPTQKTTDLHCISPGTPFSFWRWFRDVEISLWTSERRQRKRWRVKTHWGTLLCVATKGRKGWHSICIQKEQTSFLILQL